MVFCTFEFAILLSEVACSSESELDRMWSLLWAEVFVTDIWCWNMRVCPELCEVFDGTLEEFNIKSSAVTPRSMHVQLQLGLPSVAVECSKVATVLLIGTW